MLGDVSHVIVWVKRDTFSKEITDNRIDGQKMTKKMCEVGGDFCIFAHESCSVSHKLASL